MNNRINYQLILDRTIENITSDMNNVTPEQAPKLLIHSCCAPCSSYVLEYLSQYFRITVVYYNPNIFPAEEYNYRINEQQRLINILNNANISDGSAKQHIDFISTPYTPEDFYSVAKGLENEPEGGARCTECFRVRLTYAAELAKKGGFDYFTTTLSISPMKNAPLLNELGMAIGDKYGVKYLQSDFKKRNGYKRSVELSHEYGLYRQDYCGCIYSKLEREAK